MTLGACAVVMLAGLWVSLVLFAASARKAARQITPPGGRLAVLEAELLCDPAIAELVLLLLERTPE